MVTIYDIAKETGYSAPTISKALNGTGGLSEKTREKIPPANPIKRYIRTNSFVPTALPTASPKKKSPSILKKT